MCVLLKLPEDLCGALLTEWVACKGWGLLDIAVGSKCREAYRKCLERTYCGDASSFFAVDWRYSAKLTEFYRWAYSRNLRLTSLELLSGMEDELQGAVRHEYILILNALKPLYRNIDEMVNKCSKLRVLQCRTDNCNFENINPKLLSPLSGLVVDGIHSSPNCLMIIHSHCCQLETFRLLSDVPCDVPLILDILAKNPNIRHLELTVDISLLNGILRMFSGTLRSLTIRGDLTSDDLQRVLRQCPKLVTFEASRTIPDHNHRFTGCKYNRPEKSLSLVTTAESQHSWTQISSEMKDLASLRLTVSLHLRDPALQLLFGNVGQSLISLDLIFPYNRVEGDDFSHILGMCPNVAKLRMHEMSFGQITWDSVQFPSGLSDLSISTKMTVADVVSILNRCTHLESLYIAPGASFHRSSREELKNLQKLLKAYRNVQETPFKYELVQ